MTVVSSSSLKKSVQRCSRLWNASRNFDRLSAGLQLRHRLAVERQAVVMVVFVGPPRHGQPVLLVLDISPKQVVQRPQRIDLEVRQRIASAAALALVLEAQADRVHGLHQHPLLVPVRPDQLQQAWRLNPREPDHPFAKDSIDNRLVRKRISQDSVDIREPSIPEISPQSLADLVQRNGLAKVDGLFVLVEQTLACSQVLALDLHAAVEQQKDFGGRLEQIIGSRCRKRQSRSSSSCLVSTLSVLPPGARPACRARGR